MFFSLQKRISLGLVFTFYLFFMMSSQCHADNSKKIALVMKALSNPFFYKMEQGAQRYARDNDISLDVFGLKNEVDVNHQINIIESLISRNYGAIVIAPADSNKLVNVCIKAVQKGISVINIDNPLNKSILSQHKITIPFIGSDNRAGGRLIGIYFKKQLSGKGNIIIIEGMHGVKNAESRKAGFIEAVTSKSSIKIVASETANWNTEEAFSVTMKLLKNTPDIDAIFCANDKMAIGALQAIDMLNNKKQILIAGYDNIDSVRNEMQNGRINATVEQHPELMGAYGVMLAWKRLKGEPVPDEMPTPIDIITHESFNRKIGLSISILKNPFFASVVRGYGFNDELKKFSKLKVIAREVANFDRNEAKAITNSLSIMKRNHP